MIPLRLFTLGQLRLETGTAETVPPNVRRKELVLLAYLARRAPRPVSRAELATLLWEDRDEARARHSLRQVLRNLRQPLGEGLLVGTGEVRLGEGVIELDACAFERDAAAGRLREAVTSWAGEFLAESEGVGGEAYRSWLEAEREGLRRRLGWALERLTEQAERQGAWTEAVQWAERWAELLPWEEAAHLRLIAALRLAGRAGEAAARHAGFAARLRSELGQEPSAAFLRLGERLRESGAPTEPHRPGAAALFVPDLVGRAAAFQQLTAAWSEVEAGEGAVVLVEGEEGIGKTRLCQELLRWLRPREQPPLLLQASAYDTDAGADHATLRRLLAALPGAPGLGGASDAALAELSTLVPALRRRFPRLPEPIGTDAALADPLAEVLRDVAAEVPVLLLLEDIPVSDSATQRLVLMLARECPGSVLLLLSGRSEPLESGGLGAKLRQLPGLRHLGLKPLDEREVQALLDSMLALDPQARAALAARLHAESGGNPLHVVELVRALAEEGLLVLDAAGTWCLSAELAERSLPMPPRLRDATRERLAHLDKRARTVLEVAALLGPHVEPEVLEAVTGLAPLEFAAALDALVSRRLLREAAVPPLAYEFAHEVVRRIALEQLGPARRRALQRAVNLARFPALHLPRQLTSFIGRETEIAAAAALLAESRLLTLTGPAGTGKTRLGLEVATELAAAFPDGVYFVNLAPVADPARVPTAIAQVLGVQEQSGCPLLESLQAHLQEKQVLLVLDNFEQLVEAAPVVTELLAAAPRLKVLATSRVPLHVQGEQEYPVPALSLPDPRRLDALEQLTRYEAVRLFLERAQAVKPDFSVTNENAPAVAEICHRLDGLPLAIELAAARIRILPPEAILARLQSRLKLLTGGARDLPQRQQTLRGAIKWSYELLDEAEKVLFRRLAVFSGGRTLEAIEAVCDGEGELEMDVLDGVTSLVDKNLLRQEEGVEAEPRFLMLETIHEYASEKLEESGEAGEIGRRHTEFFLALAEEAYPQQLGAAQGQWLARLEAEHENLRAALSRALAGGEDETAGRLAGALWPFWYPRGHFREGRRWYAEVLAREGLSPRTRAQALYGAGILAWQQGELDVAQPLYEESLALCRELEDVWGIARALNGLGALVSERGDLDRAQALYEESLARWREIGEPGRVASLLNNLGVLALERQEYARAEPLFRESLALARQAGNADGTSIALLNLADLARKQGDLPGACGRLRESLQIARDIGLMQWATYGLAYLAQLLIDAGAAERAARLFGAAEARFAALGTHEAAPSRPEYERDLAAARAQLEPALWERLYQEGAAMTLEEALAYALEEDDPEPG